MADQKSPLYTRTGDNGTTSLISGRRVPKDTPRLIAYGTIDELNAAIGLIIAHTSPDHPQRPTLNSIQNTLFNIGATLALDPQAPPHPNIPSTYFTQPEQAIQNLEHQIDHLHSQLPPLHNFILPQGTPAAAAAHLARTICRRAERNIITLTRTQPILPEIIRYINRLSDYLFILARFNNHLQNTPEIYWNKNC